MAFINKNHPTNFFLKKNLSLLKSISMQNQKKKKPRKLQLKNSSSMQHT